MPGFDLTLSVPKSVSVVWALDDPLVQAVVVEACEIALTEASAWLEREACFVRRGSNRVRTAGDPTAFGTRRMIAEGFARATPRSSPKRHGALTEKSGTFTRFDLTRAIASTLPADTSLAVVEATVGRALASSAVVQVGDHWSQRELVHAPGRTVVDDRELLNTSRSLLDVERRLLGHLIAGRVATVGVLDAASVEAHIRQSTLGDGQARAIRALTGAGDRDAGMVGRAGTGKTHTLGTLRTAYEGAGWSVVGLAPPAREARELQEGSGTGSTTIARHLVGQRQITRTTVVVVDEAAMAGTRDIAAIVEQARLAPRALEARQLVR